MSKTVEPAKVRKLQMLVDQGLREDLSLNTIRFATSQINQVFEFINQGLENNKQSNEPNAYVIRLTGKSDIGGAKAFYVQSETELAKAMLEIEKTDMSKFHEVWTYIFPNDKENGFAGRICFDLLPFRHLSPSRVELIKDPIVIRNVEKYPHQDEPFIAYEKNSRTEPFQAKQISARGMPEDELIESSTKVLANLNSRKREIHDFAVLLQDCGASVASLDIRHAFGKTKIWDWDTNNSAKVLNTYEDLVKG